MRDGYFDANASAPLDPEAGEETARVARDVPGNPGSAHREGRAARAVLEDARERIAAAIGAKPREIVFTSGGTESADLALRGAALLAPESALVTSAVEHPAVLRTAEDLERAGRRVVRLPVDREGRVDPAAAAAEARPDVFLASVMLANNETGTIQPVAALAKSFRERGIPVHTDAVQAVGRIPVHVDDLGVDLLSAGAHKLGGPRGIGFLYVRRGTRIAPVAHGGGQEGGFRPGTPAVALAAGFAKALDLAVARMAETARRLAALRDRIAGAALAIEGVSRASPGKGCLPNTLNLVVSGVAGEALMIALDREGFCVSTGSACATGSALPSHVLLATGLSVRDVSSSIRVSLHPGNTEAEADRFSAALAASIARLREVAGTVPGRS